MALALACAAFPLEEHDLGLQSSVANCDDAASGFVNPAALGMARRLNIYASTSVGKHGGDLFALGLASRWFFTGYRDRDSFGVGRAHVWTTSYGVELVDNFYVGASYSTTNVEGAGSFSSVDLGALFRPLNRLSIGMVGRDLNRPERPLAKAAAGHTGGSTSRIEPSLDLGIAVRPFTDRFEIFMASRLVKGKSPGGSGLRIGMSMEPLDGLALSADVDGDRRISVGLRINSAKLGLGISEIGREGNAAGTPFLALTWSADRRRTFLRRGGCLARIDVSGTISDREAGLSLLGVGPRPLRRITDEIDKAAADPAVAGMVLRIGAVDAGMGTVEEIAGALRRFKRTGKQIVSYIESVGGKGYYIASVSDRIIAEPMGYVFLTGMRAEISFYKDLLGKLGVNVDYEKVGKYKTAPEIYAEDRMSEPFREQVESLLDDRYDIFISGIAKARGMPAGKLRALIDEGIIDAEDAFRNGLIDQLGYYDDALKAAGELSGLGGESPRVIRMSKRSYWRYRWRRPPKVALIYVSGGITSGDSRTDLLSGSWTTGSHTISEALRRVRRDRSIKAVVLRVNSPGGEVLASDVIWREVKATRESGKPVIASVADMAASGGYYVICGADSIVSNPSATVGSIGVFAIKPNLKGLYDKLGIRKEIFKRGENADILSFYGGFTESQRELVRRSIGRSYENFILRVAKGRGIDRTLADRLGEGRVYTGRQGYESGLVDVLGGLPEALEIAKKKAGIESPVDLIELPPRRISLRRLFLDAGLSWILPFRVFLP